MAVMKWHNEIEIFRKIKPCLILEGNIFDRFHYEGEPAHRMRDLPSYILKLLSDANYDIISFFDETKGFYGDGYGDDIQRLSELCKNTSHNQVEDDTIPCPFTDAGTVLEKIMNQKQTSTAVIMDMASRYIVAPDRIEICDVNAFTNILRAIRKSQSVEKNGRSTKNILILLVNKVNDLPAWFYLDNPDVKSIVVTTPDSNARMEFISGDNFRYFFAQNIWEKQFPDMSTNQIEKLQKRFVGMTEGFTYSDLDGMRKLCKNEQYNISQLPEVVEFYRYGIKENLWAKINNKTIQDLETELKTEILGQDIATRKVMDVIKRSVVQRNGSNRPKGVLFFAGPTGTGKTETAKRLAKNIFGDESNCIRFDMSEYRQDHSDQKLLGAPPGYIGYESGGLLTNAVKKNPFSILLFDEIEKAHPSILDKFLQILDDGRLTDGQGNTVYFSESIIIFTSNKGIIEDVQDYDKNGNIVTIRKQIVNPEKHSTKDVQQIVFNSIKNYFKYSLGRPEILNRIGDNNIIVYDFIRPSSTEDDPNDVVMGILKLQIKHCIDNVKNDNGITVTIKPSVYHTLYQMAKQSEVLENGGRGIRNLVESTLYTPLTRFMYDRDLYTPEKTYGQSIVIHDLVTNSDGIVNLSAETVKG